MRLDCRADGTYPAGLMSLESDRLAKFRASVQQACDADAGAWEASRRLVAAAQFADTLARLVAAIRASSSAQPVHVVLLHALREGQAVRPQDLRGEVLKQCTGLPPTKAVRALCVLFKLAVGAEAFAPGSTVTPDQAEQVIRASRNPYDLLLDDASPSLLDLGAGDLSFAAELADQYVPQLTPRRKTLTLHCQDRLQPGSRFGGVLHADRNRLQALRSREGLQFKFWGGEDMFHSAARKTLLPRYTIVTCHAPANPAFTYEPTRVAPAVIDAHLRRTRGEFRLVREGGEAALEVTHDGRALLFPPWKFEVRGPLALLDMVSRRGSLAVLSAIDTETFWELLSQLVADSRVRPAGVILTPALIADLFGRVHAQLMAVPEGGSVVLAELTELRSNLPRVLDESGASYRFRYVEVRRGAVFPGVPASRTARRFKDMQEEAPPWWLVLVPDRGESGR